MTKTLSEDKLVNMIVEAYIEVMGREKWNNLSAEEQHDVIMKIVSDLNNAL